MLLTGATFTQVAAGDSCSLALTTDGRVYGWGTFRSNEGATNFTPTVEIAARPILIDGLSNIIQIDAGSNHALAMDSKGTVFAWGSSEQDQLGRRIISTRRSKGKENLAPSAIALPKGPKNGIASIYAGPYHNFAISKNGIVYGWGLNNMGETGIMDNAGKDGATIPTPRIVEALKDKSVTSIGCGSHHSIAATNSGNCLAWGRMDGCQAGISNDDLAKLPAECLIKDEHNRPRILTVPQKVTAIHGAVQFVTASSEHNLAITREGKAYSWGFSANYQTGQGTTDDIEVATLIDNTAIHNQVVNFAASGGQYSILTSVAGTEIKN